MVKLIKDTTVLVINDYKYPAGNETESTKYNGMNNSTTKQNKCT